MSTTHTITSAKGTHTGTLVECMRWQAEHQGAYPDIDGDDISHIAVALADDPLRRPSDLTPEEAAEVVRARLERGAQP